MPALASVSARFGVGCVALGCSLLFGRPVHAQERDAGAPPRIEVRDLPRIVGTDSLIQSLAAASRKAAEDKARHWAFRPISWVGPPSVSEPRWSRNPIDAFVFARLEEEGLLPSPRAPLSTQLRRLHLDLVGLLPTGKVPRLDDEDATGQLYADAVQALLASPHYGERRALAWLDAARYADSNGYMHDEPRVMWPYRDYVIGAFNEDVPFDRFVVEQLAGDLLPNPSARQLTAAAFHRNTMTNTEGGIDLEEFRVEAVKDRVNATAKVFLGLTLECAQCHDHLYDPFSQREYYQLYAFFNDAEETTTSIRTSKGSVDLLTFGRRDEPRDSFVQLRGDFLSLGDNVDPGTPGVLRPLERDTRLDRLDLAQWIVSGQNPLFARVTVNRIWQEFFGLGLVSTEDDFGSRGEVPSHPELLEWLTSQFIADGFSVKSLVRHIVTSETYRQASKERADLDDPDNRLLAKQRRLRVDAEIVRDIELQAAGLLELRVGGPSVFPPLPDNIQRVGRDQYEWLLSEGANRYRRGLYTFHYRTEPYPSLSVFDTPDRLVSTTRRARSNTALQALALLNDEAFFDAGVLLGESLARGNEEDEVKLRRAFRSLLYRSPSREELDVLLRLLGDEQRREASRGPIRLFGTPAEQTPWVTVARVLLNLDEFITRE